MTKHQQQADSELHEDQLLNFLVNQLDEEVTLNLANNAKIDTEDIHEILVGATADGTSISTLCNSSQDSPSANTILYHLRRSSSRNGSNESLTPFFDEIPLNCSPSRWRSVQTSTCGPTTVMKTTQRTSITRKPSVEPPRSTPTRR